MRRAYLALLAGCTFSPEPIALVGERDAITVPRIDSAPESIDGAADGAPPPIDAMVVYDAPPDAASVPCELAGAPSGYGIALPGRSSCYRVDLDPEWWEDAQADCDGDGNGTHLVVVDDAVEHAFVRRLKPPGQNIWLGVSDIVTEADWLWVTDQATTIGWQGSLPGTNFSENCVELTEAGTWNDHDCFDSFNSGYRRRYVCEYDGVEPDPNNY